MKRNRSVQPTAIVLFALGVAAMALAAGGPARAQQPAPRDDDAQLKIFQLKYADAAEVGRVTRDAIGAGVARRDQNGSNARVTVDQRTNSLIAAGNPSDLLLMETLIRVLDVPVKADRIEGTQAIPDSLEVRLVWLTSRPLDESEPASPPPPHVRAEVARLTEIGLSDLQLAGQALLRTVVGQEFNLECAPAADVRLSADGIATSSHGRIQMDVSLFAHTTQGDELAKLRTRVVLPEGHFVALGVIPTSSSVLPRATSVFLVRVTRSEMP